MKRNQNENYIPFITFYLASMPKLIISFYSPIFLKYQESFIASIHTTLKV